MNQVRCVLLAILTLIWNSTWADAPAPEVTGSSIHWSPVTAHTINVHRGDGSYVKSLPGFATSWDAPEPGDYFLVAADDRDWSEWPRSAVVTVESLAQTGAPVPVVMNRVFLHWPPVSAASINVHRGNGTYVESLPGDSTYWLPPQLGDYFLVATNEGDWQSWPRSETITIANPYYVDDVITGLTANIYSRTAAEVFWNRVPGSGIRYQVDKDGETLATTDGTSWFYDGFSAGDTSLISVSAIYPDGENSNQRTIVVMTPGVQPNDSSIINHNNYQDILEDAFKIYFGVPYRNQLRDLATNVVNDMRSAIYPDLYGSTYTCINDGIVTFTNPYILQFEQCHEENAIYDGSLYIHETYGDTDRISSSGLTITRDADEELRFSGSLDGALSANPGWYEADDIEISITATDSILELNEASFNVVFPHLLRSPSDPLMFTPSFSGSFKFHSNNTDSHEVTVSTLERFWHSQLFTDETDWNYSEGILSVSAEDGSRLIVNAFTGNDETVFIQIANDSVIEQFEQVWDPRWIVWRQFVDLDNSR